MTIIDEEPPIKRDEVPVCSMCRCGLHKLCMKVDGQFCTCDCARGY